MFDRKDAFLQREHWRHHILRVVLWFGLGTGVSSADIVVSVCVVNSTGVVSALRHRGVGRVYPKTLTAELSTVAAGMPLDITVDSLAVVISVAEFLVLSVTRLKGK